MSLATRDEIINALANNKSPIVFDKVSVASQAAATYVSLFRQNAYPGAGAIPTSAAVCDHNLLGAMPFTQQTSPAKSYVGHAWVLSTNSAQVIEIHDRLMHLGGLVGNVATLQASVVDLNANLGTANLTERIGLSDYSEVQWWLEWYTATGSTAVTATIAVTYDDGSTGNLTGASLTATRPASFMLPLVPLIPAAQAGRKIRRVDSVTLSATTGAAGNFGITATRQRMQLPAPLANKTEVYDWAQLGLNEIHNSSCLFGIVLTSASTTGSTRIGGKIIHG